VLIVVVGVLSLKINLRFHLLVFEYCNFKNSNESIVTCFVTEDSVRIVNWFISQPTDRNYN
jgi:hypothetical protein